MAQAPGCVAEGTAEVGIPLMFRTKGNAPRVDQRPREASPGEPRVGESKAEPTTRYRTFAHPAVTDLKLISVEGGLVTVCAQGARFVLQTATTIVLARLLSPEDFGLQGMVVALTGFLGLFRDAGLGTATVQRPEVTQEQTSTLFGINVAVGAGLATCTVFLAPVLASFYHEPRLYWIAVVSGLAFVFSGLTAQHQALLMRGMRFSSLAKIDVLSLTVSSAAGIVMALLGSGYWALVGMAVVGSIVGGGSFSGIMNITSFAVQNGQVVALGTISGVAVNAAGAATSTLTAVSAPVSIAQATCAILHLDLGPLSLDVLGLQVTNEDPQMGMVFLSSRPREEDHELLLCGGRAIAVDDHGVIVQVDRAAEVNDLWVGRFERVGAIDDQQATAIHELVAWRQIVRA